MKKVAICADLHFRGRDLAWVKRQWESMLIYCRYNGVQTILCAGDILDKSTIGDRHQPDGAIIKAITEPLAVFLDSRGHDDRHVPRNKFITIVGNHDKAGANSCDALTFLDPIPGCTVVRRNEVCELEDILVACIPWDWEGGNPFDDTESLTETLDQLDPKAEKPRILLAHIQTVHAQMSEHEVCKRTGDPSSATCPPGEWKILDPDEYFETFAQHFDHIAFGDFHRRQPHYVGGLRQMDFDEEDNPAGFEIWDPATNEKTWIELDHAPKHKTLFVASQVELEATKIPAWNPDLPVRHRIRCEGFEPAGEIVAHLEADGVLIDHDVPELERVGRVAPEEIKEDILNHPHDLIDLWAKHQTPELHADRIGAMHAELDLCLSEGIIQC